MYEYLLRTCVNRRLCKINKKILKVKYINIVLILDINFLEIVVSDDSFIHFSSLSTTDRY